MRRHRGTQKFTPLVSILILVLCLLPGMQPISWAETAVKIGVLETDSQAGHYLQKNGKPILLIGDNVTQGWMETGMNFNQTAYIDALSSRGMNLLMLWTYFGTNGAFQHGDSRLGYDAPEIWPWVGSPDQRNFDLTQLNQAYFDRLKQLVAYAESKGIIVLICVHDGWTKTRFDGHPFNSALGNGPLTDSRQFVELANYSQEMPSLYNPSWTWQQKNQYFQERFSEKLISELNSYSNVIYEMFNEGNWYNPTQRNQHEQHFLTFFRVRCSNLLLTNSDEIDLDDPHNDAKVGVVTYHGDWTGRFNDFQSGFNQSPVKPYLLSEPVPGWDGTNVSLADIRRSVWEVTLAGAGWVNQNDLSFGWDPNAAIASQASLRHQAYDYAGYAARFFNNSGVIFWKMRPRGDLCSTGICLAQEGVEYVVYAPAGGTFTVNLAAGSGNNFDIRWYNPRAGQFEYESNAQGGGTVIVTSPDNNDWVAHIRSTADTCYIQESLVQTPSSATVKGGVFTAEGWKTTSNSDSMTFHIPTTVKGAVEFDVKGWSKSTSVFNDSDRKYHFFGMWDGSWTGMTGTAQIRYNPYKAHARVYGFLKNPDGSIDDTYYSLIKLRLNVQAFTTGGEDDPNAFECYANPDSYPDGTCEDQGIWYLYSWDPSHTYHFKIEWGDGAMRWYMDGQEITYYDYSDLGNDAYAPGDHIVQLGTVFYPVPLGTIYSNLKVYSGEGCTPPAPQNSAPLAHSGAISTSQNTAVSGTLTASDADGDALTYALVNNGSLGTVKITNSSTGAYTYTPNTGVSGTDMFTFKVNDGKADSNVATVTVTIVDQTPPPTPVLASLRLVSNSYAYPNEDWSNAIDGDTSGWDGTVSACDSPPYAIFAFADNTTKSISKFRLLTDTGVGYSERWVTQFTVQVSNTDTNASSFTTVLNNVAKNGGAWQEYGINAVSAKYIKLILNQPSSRWRQIGEFEVWTGGTLVPTNQAPVAYHATATTTFNITVSGTLRGSDADGDTLTYAVVSNGSKGTVQVTNAFTGTYMYTPDVGISGTDTFTFKVNDGKADSNVATVTVTIVDQAPPPTIPVLASLRLVSNSYAYPNEDWSNAIDGDTSGWDGTVSACDSPPYAIFAFADNTTKSISKFRLLTDTGVGYSIRWVTQFTVQVSTTDANASSFTTVLNKVAKYGGAWQEYRMNAVSAKYIKLILNQPSSRWRQIGEFEVYVNQ